MSEITIEFDNQAKQNIEKLKNFYGLSSTVGLIKKALALLVIASEIEMTHGKLMAKKGNHEAEIIVR